VLAGGGIFTGRATVVGSRIRSRSDTTGRNKDAVTPPMGCLTVAQQLKDAGKDIFSILYPDAHHGFDILAAGAGMSTPWGYVQYDAGATADARLRVAAFLARHLQKTPEVPDLVAKVLQSVAERSNWSRWREAPRSLEGALAAPPREDHLWDARIWPRISPPGDRFVCTFA
jgi:hypothetical protein